MMAWLRLMRFGLPMLRWLGSLWLLGLLAWGSAGLAQAQQAVPALSGHVIDASGTLTPAQRSALETRLTAFEQEHGAQVVVLLVSSTQPEDIASYANRVANTWKIGRKDIGDGLLLIVAVQDRKLRIEVAKTLEGAIPDLAAKRIIDEAITPRFKRGDYAGGIDAGLTRIMALISGEALPAPSSNEQPSGDFDWMQLGIFMFIAVPVIGAVTRGILGNRVGAVATGGIAGVIAMGLTASLIIAGLVGVVAMIFTLVQNIPGKRSGGWPGAGGNAGWGQRGGFGGGGGGFGGGFGSGGGGDFGGGGASGDW
jgi:uncharacterized protein